MTSYLVTCETCPHRSTSLSHDAATAQADAHARTHPDHSVIVEEEPNDHEGTVA